MKDIEGIKVSIVVPIYNVAPYLDKLILSVIKQTHQNIEIILVNDGSKDDSGCICDKYASVDSRIIVLHQPNSGGCKARDNGLKLVTSEWFTFVDGDDWIEPNYIEYLLQLAVSTQSDMAFSINCFTTRDREQIEFDQQEVWSAEQTATTLIYPRIIVGCWNKLYKTELIRKNNISFNVPWGGEGMYFSCIAAQFASRIAKGDRKVYNYRMNNNSSCLTKYDVSVGINSLWNIKNIRKVSIIRTNRFLTAVDWHIWKNYNFLLKLIIATNQQNRYWREYISCLLNIRLKLPKLLLHCELTKKEKMSMLKHSVLPLYYAHKAIRSEQNALKQDIENL